MDHISDFKPNRKIDSLITDITQLMNEAELALADSTSHHAEAQVALLQSREDYDSVSARLTELCASTGRTLAESACRTDAAIRNNLYRSLAITLGIGALFGLALARRRA